MKLVYLDQNHWIELARSALGKQTPRNTSALLPLLERAENDGTACFPLSLAHYIETQKHRAPDRRQRLATYMLKLSAGTTIAPPHVVLRHEIETALSPYFPGRVSPTPLRLLGSGLTHAADHNFGFQLDWPAEASVIPRHFREAVEAKFLALANEALLSGVVADQPIERPITDLGPERRFKAGLEEWRGAASRYTERELERRIYAITFSDIRNDIWSVLEANNIDQAEFAALGEKCWCALLDAMPSRRADMHLRREWAKNAGLQPKDSDLHDWAYLGVAVMYCDVVATERQVADLFSRRFAPRAKIVADLTQLPALLA